MPSCAGTIMVISTATMKPFRPRKRSLAKAKPASDEKNTTDKVTVAETSTELIMPVTNTASGLASRLLMLVLRLPPGVSGGGTEVIASFVRVATTNMKYSGKRDITTAATSMM